MSTSLNVHKHQDCCTYHTPPTPSLSQIISLQVTGKPPLDNLRPNTIFSRVGRGRGGQRASFTIHFVVFRVFKIFLPNISEKSRNHIPSVCATIIYLAQSRGGHLLDSDSTGHRLAKKSYSKQVGWQAHTPLRGFFFNKFWKQIAINHNTERNMASTF